MDKLDFYDIKKTYEKNPKKCRECGCVISYEKKYNVFCNSSCSASYNNRLKDVKKETREKISESLMKYYNNNPKKIKKIKKNNEILLVKEKNCEYCGNIFNTKRLDSGRLSVAKTCSKECSLNLMKKNISISQKERVKNGLHKGWQSRNILSYPENFFIRVLKRNKIFNECEINYKISKKDLGVIGDNLNYFLDFYFNNKKIDLEIDGKQHKLLERQESDKKRDLLLNRYGIDVYRIEWKSINTKKGKEYIKNEIVKFLNYYNNKLAP